MQQLPGQMSIFDLDMPYGKMFQEHSVATKERILESYSKNSAKSQTKQPMFLNLKRGNGTLVGASWGMGIPSLGECLMRDFGESPKDEEGSGLSQILEANVPLKYYLSAKACEGVLRRAKKRGKILDEILETALKQQIERWEKYGTKNQGGNIILEKFITNSSGDNIVGTLDASYYKGVGERNGKEREFLVISIDRAAFNQGENAKYDIGIDKTGIAQTVVAKGPGAICYCIQGNCIDRADTAGCNGKGVKKGESYTLNTIDRHAVCYEESTFYVVRRLTPLECCRLQGMPDWWCKDVPHSDAQEYKMWGNGMALPNALYIMEGF